MAKKPLRGISFTDEELTEVVWAIHNFTRKGQSRREIAAQGRAAQKVDVESRRREREKETQARDQS